LIKGFEREISVEFFEGRETRREERNLIETENLGKEEKVIEKEAVKISWGQNYLDEIFRLI